MIDYDAITACIILISIMFVVTYLRHLMVLKKARDRERYAQLLEIADRMWKNYHNDKPY